ncbi:ERCC4 domain-containing protein [Rhizobium sp. BK176]|uniref:ERCC4 domain-containing protein n=1 Tax=Rhizobium sp. BK176 TaxID=2587071 RepID=UPI002167E835|nr:ERCC4 domain-containing protein [Rhizobium sp. BK176]MCS4089980.1 ERCC4-type nuclease [Rhizobium sp. BK176]
MANPTINVWRAKVGNRVRIYVKNLPMEGQAWIEPRGTGLRGGFDGDPSGMSEAELIEIVENITECRTGNWADLLAAADSMPKSGRGRAEGKMAASRRSGIPSAKSWTDNDALKLDPNAMTHPLKSEATIIVDDREPAEFVDRLRNVRHLKVEIASLETGDFLIPGKAIIERKTGADLVASILERRLFTQADRLAEAGLRGVLMLEGNVYQQGNISLESITGTLSHLSTLGISIIPTLSLEHSAYTLVTFVKHMTQGLGYEINLHGSKPKDDLVEEARYALASFGGISANLAKVLHDHFGSIAEFANASVADLSAVPGIGPARAKKVFDILHAKSKKGA